MRLRLEQRDRIEQRLQAMLVAPRPDYLATAEERALSERIARTGGKPGGRRRNGGRRTDATGSSACGGCWTGTIHTQYDQRLTEAHKNLHALNHAVDLLQKQYTAFVRTRQAATQSYEGYDEGIAAALSDPEAAHEKVEDTDGPPGAHA
jgi:hypothetical protein